MAASVLRSSLALGAALTLVVTAGCGGSTTASPSAGSTAAASVAASSAASSAAGSSAAGSSAASSAGGSASGSSAAGSSESAAALTRPATDGPVPDAVAQACTAEASPTIAAIKERGSINWATGISPPFTFKDTDGQYAGVEPDNAAELSGILGVPVTINEYDYGLLPPAITTGKADIVGAQLFNTEERAKVVAFSDPYYISGQLFYVLKDGPFQTIADLNSPNNRFVFGTGNAQGGVAEKVIPNAPRSDAPLRGQPLLVDFLSTNRADSSMTEGGLMKVLLTQYPQLAAIGNNGRVTTERPTEADQIDPFDVAFAFGQGDAGFATCINAWVADLVDTGRMAERIEYWSQEIEGS